MSLRSSLIVFGSVIVAGVVALLIAAAGDQRARAFSLDVPLSAQVATLAPGVTACQGPIDTLVTFDGVQAWVSPTGLAVLRIIIRDQGGRRLAGGVIQTEPALAGFNTSTLDAKVRSGMRVFVCLHNRGPSPVALIGGTATASSGQLRVGSHPAVGAAALVLLRPHPRTLISLIPTVFARASLFKASWVGPWTFWVLCGALFCGFALAAVAIALAVRDQPAAGESSEKRITADACE